MAGRAGLDGLRSGHRSQGNVKAPAEQPDPPPPSTSRTTFRSTRSFPAMTGTADTEAREFHEIYALEVVVTPPTSRWSAPDMPDPCTSPRRRKFSRPLVEHPGFVKRGPAVLVAPASSRPPSKLSDLLKQQGIGHQVLNAKQHAPEAQVPTPKAGARAPSPIATKHGRRGTHLRHRAGGKPVVRARGGRAATARRAWNEADSRNQGPVGKSAAMNAVLKSGGPAHRRQRTPRVAP